MQNLWFARIPGPCWQKFVCSADWNRSEFPIDLPVVPCDFNDHLMPLVVVWVTYLVDKFADLTKYSGKSLT